MGRANFNYRSRELTDKEDLFLFVFEVRTARLRVGVALDPSIEDKVSSSDKSWRWYVHQAITLLVQ
jgi:hypothetical protein